SLTALPNRVLFRDRLEHGIARARREGAMLAVLYLDLDNFKHINDTLGHHVGDELLRQISARLTEKSRDGDTVARLGGDEFVVILENDASPQTAAHVAHKIIQLFAAPFSIGERDIFITTSVGISIVPSDGADPDTLLKQADLAMYKAKQQGRNTFQFYEATLSAQALERMTLENALRGACQRREFFLHFQPQVNLADGRLMGVETLVRWQHPELGLVPPARFIPVAEELGIIGEIGDWVLAEACQQMARWREAGFDMPRLAVNLSVQQLEREDLAGRVSELLMRWQIPADRLELEVTESMLMGKSGRASETLEGLRRLGVYLAVDDFGTGYSSLGYLKRLPVHRLKIDYSFVRDIGRDRNSENLVQAVIALGNSLGLELVAEGVEQETQAEFLRQAGCPIAQGYLYSRPVPAAEVQQRWGAISPATA
ncbi:MAG TPA: EAL domain-containing protein, partial [Azospira sp.]|nr:EAL domain-containing protein [Azospira sp.]